jgi:hypothetical protein
VDLKGIDAWTREALEHEARRRGIIDAELRSRGELIRMILQSGYSRAVSQGARRIARGFKSIDHAREMLSVALETAADLRARLPLPGRTGRTLVGMPAPVKVTWHDASPEAEISARERAGAGTGSGSGSLPLADDIWGTETDTSASASASVEPVASTPTPDANLPSPSFAAAAAVAAVAAAPFVEPEAASAERLPSVAARVGGREPAAPRATGSTREPGTHSFVDEPIRTHSMARLLAAQGHAERAIAIYEELLAQNSEASALREELAALRRGEQPLPPETRLPEPPAVKPLDTGDRLSCERASGEGLELSWSVSDAGQARARAVLGHDGELTVRLVRICPDPERVVRSEITEHGPVAANGRWHTASAAAGERWVAAVGLRTGARFVSIAHTGP